MTADAVLIVVVALVCVGLGLAVGLPLGRRLGQGDPGGTLEGAVSPLQDTLRRVEALLHSSETDRAESHGELRAQVAAMNQTQQQLSHQTSALVTALRAPQVRGRWGEIQLRRLVESAGMLAHCDFLEQKSSTTEEGVLRPDLLVRLTDGRSVVVDAKVPFAGFIDALEADDDATRRVRMRQHARHVRSHIDGLSGKAYAERFTPSPEFVVMFLPSDGFLQSALEVDPGLLEYGFDRDIVVATPSTLLALLRTVAYSWRQDAVAAEAQQILDLGRELHKRLGTMSAHLTKLGSSLTASVSRFNETVGSYERQVAVSARRFHELGVTSAQLTEVRPIERLVRQPRDPPDRPDREGPGAISA